ncbi:MAG: GrpB family protein [Actinomycetota bacterium]|nr:GrpB family protein [Actinomycetota bacterium]
MSGIEVVPYNPAWPALFEEERRRIEAALGEWVQGGIEHVGSTAVPGLAAKPVIDIMVGVANLEEARGAFADVASLGYLYAPYKSEFMHWFCKPSVTVRTHHLYLMEKGHPEWQAHIAFRDHLRNHPETAEAYERLKLDLANRFRNDREAYTEAKTDFVARVVATALGRSRASDEPTPSPAPAESYDAVRIAGFFDSFADQEWLRLEADAAQRISLHLHNLTLKRHIQRGDRVLEIGAGPGRFTLELARLGASVTVTDISPAQLELNRTHVTDAGHAGSVSQWAVADVTNLDAFGDASFDGTVAFGGPLSYALDRRGIAVAEMCRVTRPGGYLALSVMSRAGAFRKFLSFAREVYDSGDPAAIQAAELSRQTGDLVDPKIQTEGHYMHLFTAAELRALLEAHGLAVVEMGAANFITVQNEDWLDTVDESSDLWRFVVELEERFAGETGTVDGGTHIIAVARTPVR